MLQRRPGYTSDAQPTKLGGLIIVPARFSAANRPSEDRMNPANGLARSGRISGVLPTAADCLSQARRPLPILRDLEDHRAFQPAPRPVPSRSQRLAAGLGPHPSARTK